MLTLQKFFNSSKSGPFPTMLNFLYLNSDIKYFNISVPLALETLPAKTIPDGGVCMVKSSIIFSIFFKSIPLFFTTISLLGIPV